MQLLAVREDTFINPDKINSIKVNKTKTGVTIVINLAGQAITLKRPIGDFLTDLADLGIDLVDRIESATEDKLLPQFTSV